MSQGLRKNLESLSNRGGWISLSSLIRYLLSGILPGLQSNRMYCFRPVRLDHTQLEAETTKVAVSTELSDAIEQLADQYQQSISNFIRTVLWLGLELERKLNPHERFRLTKEEFAHQAARMLHDRSMKTKIH